MCCLHCKCLMQIPPARRNGPVYTAKISRPVVKAKNEETGKVPDVKGMGLKDALYLLESRDIRVAARGTGKVKQQSIPPGTLVSKNQKLILDLNE